MLTWARRWKHAATMSRGRERIKSKMLLQGLQSTRELREALGNLLTHPTIADALRKSPPPFTSEKQKQECLWGRLMAVRAAVSTLSKLESLDQATRRDA